MSTLLELATETAIAAGRFLKQNVGKIKQIDRKLGQETNLVTEIDRKAESMIIERIRKRYPQHGFLGEESGGQETDSEYKWVIDPLDGTTNFTHGLPIFCVSVGLEHKGELLLGVVYDPNMDELFTTEKDGGAFLNNKRIHVSTTNKLGESLLVTGFPYDIKTRTDGIVAHFENFLKASQAVRRLGSAALDLCYVAAGRFDGYWENSLNPWDMAAGVLLVQEAGGTVSDFRGFPSTIYQKPVLATNGKIHEQMIEMLARSSK
ncbi:MAG: inositol monophosphatase [Ignavibacteriae bacterium]|nr:inositol monophosphatase [Ignavibacteriota bacterium]